MDLSFLLLQVTYLIDGLVFSSSSSSSYSPLMLLRVAVFFFFYLATIRNTLDPSAFFKVTYLIDGLISSSSSSSPLMLLRVAVQHHRDFMFAELAWSRIPKSGFVTTGRNQLREEENNSSPSVLLRTRWECLPALLSSPVFGTSPTNRLTMLTELRSCVKSRWPSWAPRL